MLFIIRFTIVFLLNVIAILNVSAIKISNQFIVQCISRFKTNVMKFVFSDFSKVLQHQKKILLKEYLTTTNFLSLDFVCILRWNSYLISILNSIIFADLVANGIFIVTHVTIKTFYCLRINIFLLSLTFVYGKVITYLNILQCCTILIHICGYPLLILIITVLVPNLCNNLALCMRKFLTISMRLKL